MTQLTLALANQLIDAIFDEALKMGGTLSGEHGTGTAKSRLSRAHQALRQNRAQVVREVHEDLAVLLLREHVDDAVERFGSVVGVQRAEHQVTRTRHIERGLHRLAVADLTDLDDIRRGAHRALERAPIGFGVEPDFALVDDRLLVGVQKLDRILNRNDV